MNKCASSHGGSVRNLVAYYNPSLGKDVWDLLVAGVRGGGGGVGGGGGEQKRFGREWRLGGAKRSRGGDSIPSAEHQTFENRTCEEPVQSYRVKKSEEGRRGSIPLIGDGDPSL